MWWVGRERERESRAGEADARQRTHLQLLLVGGGGGSRGRRGLAAALAAALAPNWQPERLVVGPVAVVVGHGRRRRGRLCRGRTEGLDKAHDRVPAQLLDLGQVQRVLG